METVGATDYHDIAQAFDPDVAPAGDRVAFARRQPSGDDDYEDTVYVAEFGGGTRRYTAEAGRDSSPRWSPSGDRLAFVSTRADDDTPQLWVLPADGGEARQVTDVAGGVSSIAWSPDGERVAFTQSATAEEREVGHDLDADDDYEPESPDPRVIDRLVYRSQETYFDGRRSHVYVADLADDSVERVTDGDVDHASPAWSDADTLHYAVRRTGDPDDNIRYDVDAFDLATGDAETLVETTGWPHVAVAGDGRVAYQYTPEDRFTLRQTEIRVYDPAADETHEPTAGLDRMVSAEVGHKPAGFEWGPDDDRLYFVTPDDGAYVVWRAPGDASADPEPASTGRHVHGFSTGGDALAVTASEWDHPGDVFASTLGGGEESRLTRLNAGYLDDRAVRQPEEVGFESADGVEVQGWVLTPPGFDPDEEYPLVVEVHGGPHAMWSTSGTMWHEFQTLAARGYVVFWCNPRGSAGYGEAFMAAIERDWGDVTAADALAGVETVAARDYVDDDEVFVTGGSFGGYMAAWLVGTTDRFDAAVAQRGVYHLAGFYGSTDAAFKLVEGDFGTTPWEEPEFLWARSPVAYADQVDAPTLVMHAEHDYRVAVNDAELLFRGLKKHGVETRFVRYPDEGHELSRSGQPAHVVDRVERIARWFDGYSSHHDAPKALERSDEGLSMAEDEDDDGSGGDGEDDTGGDEE
jgi:dipeptidyl aminopeptidase/acylaminoacyl peptidase